MCAVEQGSQNKNAGSPCALRNIFTKQKCMFPMCSTEHGLQTKNACSPCVLPYINDKLLSCLALNVCELFSEMKYRDFVSFISNCDISL